MPVVGNHWMEGKRKGRQEGLLVSMDKCPWGGGGKSVGRQRKMEEGEWESRKGKVEERVSYTHYI